MTKINHQPGSRIAVFAVLLGLVAADVPATDYTKADNTTNLNLAGSYTANSGTPGLTDTIVVDSTVTALRNTSMGSNLSINGIRYASNAQTGDRLRINSTGGYTLSIGAGGIDMSLAASNTRLRIDANLALTANQTWNLASGVLLKINPTSITNAGGNATVTGAGTVDFSLGGATGTLGSAVTFNNSVVQLNLTGQEATFSNSANTFGRLNIYNGTATFADIANSGVASSAGTGSDGTYLGSSNTNGVMIYSGATASTNRTITVDRRSAASGILVSNSGSTLTVSGAISHNAGTDTGVQNNAFRVGGAGNLVLSGTISDNSNASYTTSLAKEGAGTLTLSGANSFQGGVTVSAGGLLVTNTTGSGTGSGAVTIASGASLGGSGTISGLTTINGTLAPGTSPGTLTLAGGLTLNGQYTWEINSAGEYDSINLTSGDLLLGGSSTFYIEPLSVDFSDSYWSSNRTWAVVNNSGSGTLSGTFASLAGTTSNSFGSFSLLYGSGAGADVTLSWTTSAIPEPSTYALLAGLGGLALVVVKRRRKTA